MNVCVGCAHMYLCRTDHFFLFLFSYTFMRTVRNTKSNRLFLGKIWWWLLGLELSTLSSRIKVIHSFISPFRISCHFIRFSVIYSLFQESFFLVVPTVKVTSWRKNILWETLDWSFSVPFLSRFCHCCVSEQNGSTKRVPRCRADVAEILVLGGEEGQRGHPGSISILGT